MTGRSDHRPHHHDHGAGESCSHCRGTASGAGIPEGVATGEGLSALVRPALVQAIFGASVGRRAVLKALGVSTALAVIDRIVPIGTLEALAQDAKALEKRELTIGFIPITCAAPLAMADQNGLFQEAGLDVELVKTPGWKVVRERLLKSEYDAAHVLSPMPLAMTLGADGPAANYGLAMIQNTNGQGLTLATKHADKRNPKDWKGLKFAIPYEYSVHNFLLRYYLADHGLDPDKDVTITLVQPLEVIHQLKAGTIDGFLLPDLFAQLAVQQQIGFIHILTKDIWDGHPCCGFTVSRSFVEQAPNTYLALTRAVLKAALYARAPDNRKTVSTAVAQQKYLNQPVEVLEPIFTGSFDDGLGGKHTVPNRIDFDPMPYQSFAVWMLTQMKRWGMVKDEVNYSQIAEQVFLTADAGKLLKDLGAPVAADPYAPLTIMGKTFDARHPEDYLKGFAIRKS